MKLYLSPQRNDNNLSYVFEDDNTVTVTYNDELTETFTLHDNFEEPSQGDDTVIRKTPKILPVNPILSVRYEENETFVTLLRYHGRDPSDDVAWPDWIEVEYGTRYPNN